MQLGKSRFTVVCESLLLYYHLLISYLFVLQLHTYFCPRLDFGSCSKVMRQDFKCLRGAIIAVGVVHSHSFTTVSSGGCYHCHRTDEETEHSERRKPAPPRKWCGEGLSPQSLPRPPPPPQLELLPSLLLQLPLRVLCSAGHWNLEPLKYRTWPLLSVSSLVHRQNSAPTTDVL